MENELFIRRAKWEDLPTIRKLAEKVWPFTYKEILSARQINYMMELFYSDAALKEQFNKHQFLVVYREEEPVGFASYSPASAAGIYKLHKLYVNTEVQRRGTGKALVDFIIADIQRLGATALELNVNRNNKAKSFYERMGFELIRQEDIDIGNDCWMNDYVMRLGISASLPY